MTNQDYKNAALSALKGNWAPAVLATIVFMVIAIVIGYVPKIFVGQTTSAMAAVSGGTGILTFLVLLPLEVGFYYAFVKLLKEGDNDILGNSFRLGFSGWFHKVITMFLVEILLMVGFMFFIIPGLILTFAYSMVPYLLVKHPEISITETLRASRTMMKGHKFDYFYLELSFIGWIILGLLTAGIGLFWVEPYLVTASAAFWDDLYAQTHPETEE